MRAPVAQGADATVYAYVPPKPNFFHAKVVAGRTGYLGSANLTASGLGEHVEPACGLRNSTSSASGG